MVAMAACARDPELPSVTPAAEPEQAVPRPPAHETFSVDPELAEAALAAIDLWTEASGGAYAPRLVVGDAPGATRIVLVSGMIADCGGEESSACMRHSERLIELSTSVPADMRASAIAHEIGHNLGLEHTAEGLMDPSRSNYRRRSPCVLAADVQAAGLDGPGACLD
jgi:hypothetical protein